MYSRANAVDRDVFVWINNDGRGHHETHETHEKLRIGR